MINGILKKIADKYIFKELAVERQVQAINLRKAKTLGLLFCANEKTDYLEVRKLINDIESNNKQAQVYALGWYKGNKVPEHVKQGEKLKLFNKKDYNLLFRPKKAARNVFAFVERDYDMLIDLTQNEHYPIRKVLALSHKVKFKVGSYQLENEPYYDFMVKFRSAKDYTQQLVHYLSLLNKNER